MDHLQLENMIGFELFARLYIFNLHLNIQLNRWRWMIAATFCNICRSFFFFTANTNCVSASCTIFATWSWAIPLIHKKCTPQAILTKKGTYEKIKVYISLQPTCTKLAWEFLLLIQSNNISQNWSRIIYRKTLFLWSN